MSVYTKQGDRGMTKVFDKKTGELVKIRKSSCQIRSIGQIDELNSFLGVIVSSLSDPAIKKRLRDVQSDLFTVNAIIAGGNLVFGKDHVKKLEKEIDIWEGNMPVQTNFIYYGGCKESSLLFFARAICRRAERSFSKFETFEGKEIVSSYINRLSDWLFTLAKKINFQNKIADEYWITKK